MAVFPIHPRARVIHVLPSAAVQPGFHDGLLFLLEWLLCAGEQLGDLTVGNQNSYVLQQIGDLWLRHVAQMGEQQAQAFQVRPEFPGIALRQRRQVGFAARSGVILFLAKSHVVGADAQILHDHFLIALELRVRRKCRPVQLQHLFPINPNPVQLATLTPLTGF